MRWTACVPVLLIVATPAMADTTPSFRIASGFFFGAVYADMRTTQVALAQDGGFERNPLMGDHPSNAQLYVRGTAFAAAWWYASYRVHRSRPRLGIGMLWAGFIVEGLLAAHNHHVSPDN